MAEDSELWDIICDGPHVPMKKLGETGPMVPKDRKEYSDVDQKAVEKKYRAKKILALAAWGFSSSESEREPEAENSSMMALETEATKYDSLFALMAQSDDDEEDENDEEILTIELREAEQSRDDLVVCVVDLNETIANLEKEKEALNEKINSVEKERDGLMVVVVDLKETIEGLSNEKNTLEEKIAATEQERDDFLVIITDLEETIERLNSEHRTVSLGKGKEVASETHIKLEKELNDVKTSRCRELEKNRQLQAELEKVKINLEKSLLEKSLLKMQCKVFPSSRTRSAGKST
ncbi:PREDICTED: protein Hook homolog 3-like [Nicotiana attenuata]|uniref:protein Hook homolog 3-like n=1 Tax=Nicotiana attenuata TaxID=49451 RepID=UPI0009059DEB|nr:PREDICTED: protein Hook homolog 3-like [Nicotiana attenuata]